MLLLLIACTSAPKDDTGEAVPPPTFTEVQSEIFTPSCAFSTCHGNGGGGAANLDLSEGKAHVELVNVESTDAPGEILVVPGNADASYLVKKCTPGAADIVGELMPDGSDGLDEERLAMLRAWVDAGALDD